MTEFSNSPRVTGMAPETKPFPSSVPNRESWLEKLRSEVSEDAGQTLISLLRLLPPIRLLFSSKDEEMKKFESARTKDVSKDYRYEHLSKRETREVLTRFMKEDRFLFPFLERLAVLDYQIAAVKNLRRENGWPVGGYTLNSGSMQYVVYDAVKTTDDRNANRYGDRKLPETVLFLIHEIGHVFSDWCHNNLSRKPYGAWPKEPQYLGRQWIEVQNRILRSTGRRSGYDCLVTSNDYREDVYKSFGSAIFPIPYGGESEHHERIEFFNFALINPQLAGEKRKVFDQWNAKFPNMKFEDVYNRIPRENRRERFDYKAGLTHFLLEEFLNAGKPPKATAAQSQ